MSLILATRGGDSLCGNSRTDEGGSDSALTPLELALISAYRHGNSRRRVKWEATTVVGVPMQWGFYDHTKWHFHVVLFDYDVDRFHERVDAAMEAIND